MSAILVTIVTFLGGGGVLSPFHLFFYSLYICKLRYVIQVTLVTFFREGGAGPWSPFHLC